VSVQPVKGIGRGAYGVVCSARVAGTGDKVAIKKIQNAFENDTDARRALREVMLLRQLHHENIIVLKDIMIPAGAKREAFKDVYFVYELMDTDLHKIILSKQPLSDEHFQYFLYQVQRWSNTPSVFTHGLVYVPNS
jgi:serine/threonine protein kinase